MLSRVVSDDVIRSYFKHDAHRTAMSQRALQSLADPWLGYIEIQGLAYVVQEISPHTNGLACDELVHPDDVSVVLDDLGRAAAKAHCLGDRRRREAGWATHYQRDFGRDRRPARTFVGRVVDLLTTVAAPAATAASSSTPFATATLLTSESWREPSRQLKG